MVIYGNYTGLYGIDDKNAYGNLMPVCYDFL